ncbi:DUF262 domain-containing protein (plasmid) [Paenibacillus thiaminolyticus]|uniref:DUF262 domain-containing protein n=1 Tax=Paenibacillus thiaminolyticus TaxID=49283 RepID=UPI0023301F6D|nr:DUF262 domain-containing protein [Paenibacillus thiaminolyticus]WCF11623.1 DUF262 domain-containing protein [Paenibacillus thiaminolyticus]
MKVGNQTINVEKLQKLHKTKSVSFDMKIQRSEDIWDKKRRSKMIHSILIHWPTNNIFAYKDGRLLSIIDGKQRLTTVLSFINNKFALDKSTPPVNGEEVAGKKFDELSEDLQQAVMLYKFEITQVEDTTMEELEEFFFRLNSGMPLRQIETTRAILGGKVLKLIEDVANTPFFQTKANLSRTSKKRFVDQELVLQILAVIHKKETGFGGKEIQEFVRELRLERLQDELKSKMQNASFYLNQAFVKKEKFLRKIHIPSLFKLVLDIQEEARLISPADFEEWARSFFENMPADYSAACQSKTAQKENVMIRFNSMKAHFEDYFKDHGKKVITDEDTQESAS